MYCIHCGERVVESAKFCAACGEKIQRPKGEEQRSERSLSVDRDVDSEANSDLNTPAVEPPTDSPVSAGVPLTFWSHLAQQFLNLASLRGVVALIRGLVAMAVAITLGAAIAQLIIFPLLRAILAAVFN